MKYDQKIILKDGNPEFDGDYPTELGVLEFTGHDWWLDRKIMYPVWYMIPDENTYPKDFIVWLMGKDNVDAMYKRYLKEKI